MAFNSFHFLVFFPAVVLIYYIIPVKLRTLWLLGASYYFYMSWNASYGLLILFSTVVTYFGGRIIGALSDAKKKKAVLILTFLVNLGILFVFKYLDMTIDLVNVILSPMGIKRVSSPFSLILPVGISFYTFQALSYAADVYRNETEPEKNFINYALFVSFFPQLVAGPIERSKKLLSNIKKVSLERNFSYEKLSEGFMLMTWGMFQKMVIADRISFFVDGVFGNPQAVGFVEGVFGAIAFAIQIYCDFSGYSNIAVGAGRIMGFDLMENFNTPYFAGSIAEFWRRWHISLSLWFRDYVYIPLGGNRKGRVVKYRNILITFLLSGLWHGADLSFVVWGGIHGLYQIAGDLLKPVKEKTAKLLKVNTEAFSHRLLRIFTTFTLTCFAWVFFRASSVKEALVYFKHMITRFDPWSLFDESLFTFGLDRREVGILMAALIILVIVDIYRYMAQKDIGRFMGAENLWFRWIVYIALMVACVVYGEYGVDFDSAQFIYFRF
ncbi:MAG: MBOAT family protein [Lachnospiraceae bacterium]|nr:MBOAT family protein [Lachnospiraceae bacterium]